MAIAQWDWRLSSRPVSRDTVQDRVYDQLVAMILDGEIEAGRTMTIAGIAKALEVSAMPAREALHRFTATKAQQVVAGRSVGVPPLTVERLWDPKRVRSEIEGLAAEWTAAKVTPATLARLDELIEAMSSCVTPDARTPFLPANREFHFTVYAAAGSPTLLALIESFWLRIGRTSGCCVVPGTGAPLTGSIWPCAMPWLVATAARREPPFADIDEAAAVQDRLLRS